MKSISLSKRSTGEAITAGVKSEISFQHIGNLSVEGEIRSEGKRTLVKWNHDTSSFQCCLHYYTHLDRKRERRTILNS